MTRSIRWRLQTWYAVVLLGVVVSFAVILYYRVRTARLREVDAQLTAVAQYLDASLRRGPPPEPDGPRPERPRPGRPPPGPEGKDRFEDRPLLPPPPPGRPGERPDREPSPPGGPGLPPQEGDEPYYVVWNPNGDVLHASTLPEDISPPDIGQFPPPPHPLLRRRGEFREALLRGPRVTRILVGRSMRHVVAELTTFAWQLAGVSAVVLAIGLTGGYLSSGRLLRPLAAMSATASAISATNLSRRIPVEHLESELSELAGVLNAMFDRLEAAFERQTRFTADASHELRTPLAIVRAQAELALSRPRSSAEYREAVETCLRASQRMTALVEALLTLARADAGKLELRREPVAWGRVVEEGVALCRPLAERKQITFEAEVTPVRVAGDAGRLSQVVTNLVSNAIQYNHPGGAVRVRLTATGGASELSVSDTGCGIPEEDRPHIFERFYRVDKARARESGGNGLGLAICKSIVEAHGGRIGFRSAPGEGTTFWVRLPCE